MRLYERKLEAVKAFGRANRLDRMVWDSHGAWLGVATTGKSYLDVRQAFEDLGVDEEAARRLGIRLSKVAMPFPLEPDGARRFAGGLETILRKHVFQNIGDGTYFHSGLLSIRAAIAAGVNVTFKILYNDAVVMTGGQQVDGPLTVSAITGQMQAEGARRVVVVTDEPDFRLEFHLAPPLLARRDSNTGEPRKGRYGTWMMRVFTVLSRFRGLRGTPLDPFGYTAERRRERRLIERYERVMSRCTGGLDHANHAIAVEIASLPDRIRGFGHVKARSIEEAERREADLLARFAAVVDSPDAA